MGVFRLLSGLIQPEIVLTLPIQWNFEQEIFKFIDWNHEKCVKRELKIINSVEK